MRELNRGLIEWISVDEILNSWGSYDSEAVQVRVGNALQVNEWDELLAKKRNDSQFEELYEIIHDQGFLVPLNYYIRDDVKIHGNGHHRLAVAICLGYTHIPYIKSPGAYCEWYDFEDFPEGSMTEKLVMPQVEEKELVAA